MEEILSGWGSEAYKHYCLLKMLTNQLLFVIDVGCALVLEDAGNIRNGRVSPFHVGLYFTTCNQWWS
jgi:hypothetical protein